MNANNSPHAIVARVRAQIEKKASDDGGVASEGDRGTVTPPSNPPLEGVPANIPNAPGGGVEPYDKTLKPGDHNENVPTTTSQNAKDDAATSPTTDLSKIAARVQRISAAARAQVDTQPAKAAGAPASAQPTPTAAADVATTATAPAKAAGAAPFDTAVLTKMGSLLVQTEEGRRYGLNLLEVAEGEKFAAAVLQEAVVASQHFEQYSEKAAADHFQALAEASAIEQHKAAAAQEFNDIYAAATPAERAEIEFFAKLASWADTQPALSHPLLKQAFADGMTDGAEDMESMEAGEELPTGEEEPSPEEIAMLIQQALQAGKIDEATAMALMDELAGGATQTPEEAGAVDPAMEEEMKAAAALVFTPAAQ